MFGPALLGVVIASASLVLGEARWQEGQISTRICYWRQLRATVLRDTLYLDGGSLWWQPTFADGSAHAPVSDNNQLGLIYTLNFSTPFSTTENISAILGTLETGGGNTNNRAPNYEDGALLGNNEEFFLYGGLPMRTAGVLESPGDQVLCYEKYPYGGTKGAFEPSFINKPLGEDTTRYVAYGGGASAPSENLAWYFSGMQSPSKGVIYAVGAAARYLAVNVSDTLITLDMAKQGGETFTNHTLGPGIHGRANPELVWVPVGERGILVALGGVVYPDFIDQNGTSTDLKTSRSESPEFMSTIDIYDVASQKWYRQKTHGGPDQRTRGCAVVATAQDGSSFNIYYYGGYDGVSQKTEPFSDDVWVLSLPSFTWVKLASSTAEGRAGHKCVMPYPDQMLVVGGYLSPSNDLVLGCLRETIRVFNLSTGKWLDRYDPAVYSDYTVPTAVYEKIGGSGTGGATVTSPSPSWDATELAGIFASQYPMSKIKAYYPYPSVGPVNNTNPDAPLPPAGGGGGGGLPSYLPPVLGVVLGLVFLTMVAVLILLWRRRRLLRSGGTMSEAGTEDTNKHRITSWLRGQPSEVKAPTVTTASEYTPTSTTDVDSVAVPQRSIAEMMNTEVQMPVELPDTSPPAELSSTAAGSHAGSVNNPTLYPATHQTDHATPPPHSSSPHPSPPPIPLDSESPVFYRPDSDALGQAPTTATSAATSPTGTTTAGASPVNTAATSPSTRDKVLSGISNLSERDRAHLRQISDTTVSSVTTAPGMGASGGNGYGHGGGVERERMLSGVSALSTTAAYNGGGGATAAGDQHHHHHGHGGVGVVESPAVVSPPTATAGPGEGADYLSARPAQGQQSPLRRSVFQEDINEDRNADAGGSRSGPGNDGARGQ